MTRIGVIYLATNVKTGKSYIGQTWNWRVRKKQHIREAARLSKRSPFFYNAIRKYGPSAFEWCVLYAGAFGQDDLDMLEEREIRRYKTMYPGGYNLRGGGARGIQNENTKKKIGKAHKGRVVSESARIKISVANKGIKRSSEFSARASMYLKQRWADPIYREHITAKSRTRKHSAVTRRIMSDSQKLVDKSKQILLFSCIAKSRKGKTYEELYGKEKADAIKLKVAIASRRPRKNKGTVVGVGLG